MVKKIDFFKLAMMTMTSKPKKRNRPMLNDLTTTIFIVAKMIMMLRPKKMISLVDLITRTLTVDFLAISYEPWMSIQNFLNEQTLTYQTKYFYPFSSSCWFYLINPIFVLIGLIPNFPSNFLCFFQLIVESKNATIFTWFLW